MLSRLMLSFLLIFWSVFKWILRLVLLAVILWRRRPPAVSLAWLTLIFAVPEVGVVLYLLMGEQPLGRAACKQYRAVSGRSKTASRVAQWQPFITRPQVAPAQMGLVTQAEHVSGNPILGGCHVDLIAGDRESLRAAIGDIDAAEHHVHLLYYIFWPDEVGRQILEAMMRAARRGVRCRLLVDAVGSRPLLKSALLQAAKDAGVQVAVALEVKLWRLKLARIDVRNHRKIAVIDGRIGYTGSHNVVSPDYGGKASDLAWVDLSGRFTGPVVSQLQMVFLDDWAFETGEHLESEDLFPPLTATGEMAMQVIPTGPTHETETFRRVLVAALHAAQRRIVMTTPYLIPDDPTLLALAMAADRGVHVTLVVPEIIDQPLVAAASDSYHEQLMLAGIELLRYQGGLLHAKTITVDSAFGLLGSVNLDNRSFDLNFEIAVLLYGPQITAQLRRAQHAYITASQHVDLDTWRRRPRHRQILENAANILSPLL